jgi:hypothetical protein
MSLFLYVCNVFKKNEKYTSLAAEKEPVSFVSRAIFDSICRGYVSFHSIIKTDSSSGQPINDLLWVVLCVLFRAQSEIQMLTGHYDTSCCIFAALFLKKNILKDLISFRTILALAVGVVKSKAKPTKLQAQAAGCRNYFILYIQPYACHIKLTH